MAGNDFVPEYGVDLPDDELLDYFWECLESSQAHTADWRNGLPGLYKMYAGKTISPQDQKWSEDIKRVTVELNMVLSNLNAIVGADWADRQEVEFQPIEADDPTDSFKAQALTHLAQVLAQRCRGQKQDMSTILHMAIAGMGFTETYLDTGRRPFFPVKKSVPPWEMYWDPDAIEDNLTDARWFIRHRQLRLEEAQARWPKKAKELASLHQDIAPAAYDITPIAGRSSTTWARRSKDKVPVYEFQYIRQEPRILYATDQGESRVVTREEFKRLSSALTMEGFPEPSNVEFPARVVYRAFVATTTAKDAKRGEVLSRAALKLERPLYEALTAYRDFDPETRRCVFFGPIAPIADPQKYVNKVATTILDILARQPKGGGLFEQDALGNTTPDAFIKEQSTAGMWTEVGPGSLTDNRIQPNRQVAYPEGMERFFSMMMNLFPELSSVSSLFKGSAVGERSSVLVANQQQQAIQITLAILYSNIEMYRSDIGRKVVSLALTEAAPVDVQRLLGRLELEGVTYQMVESPQPGGPAMQEPITDPVTGEPVTAYSLIKGEDPFDYDVSVEIGAYSPTAKAQFWAHLDVNGMGKAMLEGSGMVLMPDLLRYSTLPVTIADRLARKIEGMVEQQNQVRSMDDYRNVLAQMSPDERAMQLTTLAQEFLPPPEAMNDQAVAG